MGDFGGIASGTLTADRDRTCACGMPAITFLIQPYEGGLPCQIQDDRRRKWQHWLQAER